MLKEPQKYLLFFICIISSILWLAAEIDAALWIKDVVVTPNRKELFAGSEPIELKVRASGERLTYSWGIKPARFGSFDGDTDTQTVRYVPPETISQKAVQVVITVTVTDDEGEVAEKEEVNLTILKENYCLYVVKSGETLSEIAKDVTGTSTKGEQIQKFNKLPSVDIWSGDKLRIPKDILLEEFQNCEFKSLYPLSMLTLPQILEELPNEERPPKTERYSTIEKRIEAIERKPKRLTCDDIKTILNSLNSIRRNLSPKEKEMSDRVDQSILYFKKQLKYYSCKGK